MPTISISEAKEQYDAVIVGSGAGGGQMAYSLTLAGLKCVVLEAGRSYNPYTETPMFNRPDQAPLGGTSTPDKDMGFWDATVDGGWDVPGEPYTQGSDDKKRRFTWWRARMMGGRTNHWGRISLRNGPYDFKPYSYDGLGFDWPISYEEVKPYYDKVEMLIGVHGTNEGLENVPDSPPGVLQPPPKGRIGDLLTQKAGKKVGVPVVPIHRAVLTKPLAADTIPAKLHPGNKKAQEIVAKSMRSRAACFYATSCGRGCSIGATYQSTIVHLPPAEETGNLDIIANAHVREVETGPDGKATGVVFIDKTTGKEERVKGKVVILAASSGETVRIMLNSRSNRHPEGVANGSGIVGRYITDTAAMGLQGQIPALENLPPHNEDGAGGSHFYSPWWGHEAQRKGKLDFPRGYHIEVGSTRNMPGGNSPVSMRYLRGLYGTKLKEEARRYYGSFITLASRGEMIPNEDSFAEIDPKVKDKWGVPVVRWHWKWSDYELNMALHAERTFAEIFDAMGGKATRPLAKSGHDILRPGGNVKHEVGGARMGFTPKDSVCNKWSQTWDVKNLFLCDASTFVSNPDKNPTLTIMALAWRCADYIIEQSAKGNL
ncbi:GMC family oxidoreductase [Pelagicoccus mobilis]|uniref:GMC family oxidoreductase n=1 Tax=Pelagicoccus mobilis TaxID=415221 RepID=A0A934S4T6_9BACT|nr:GMC family oxidoreductase [Pelagicoccus mobilis]MBK1879003.1 GMC family oxidoreductase [Pelagicoccus mobilis]